MDDTFIEEFVVDLLRRRARQIAANVPLVGPQPWRGRYSFHEPGFLRMNVAGLRFVFIDTRVQRPIYSDRAHGWRIGWLLFRVSFE